MIKKSLIIFCFFINSAFGSQIFNDASQFLARLSPDEGLSQSSVTKTLQDSHGFIWIATEQGLNRYDGYQNIQIAGPNNVLKNESISTIFIDDQNYLWVSTVYSGLYRLNTSTLEARQFFSGKLTADGNVFSQVMTIAQGKNHNLWLGVSEHVFLMDTDSGKLTKYLSLNTKDDIIRDFYVENELVYCATSQGLYRINIQSHHSELLKHRPDSFSNIYSNNTKLLVKDRHLGLLVGTVEGLFQLNAAETADKNGAKLLIPDLNIWDMLVFGEEYLVATNKGVYLFNPKTLSLSFVLKFSDSHYQITDNNVRNLYKDRTGNIWLASKSQGVFRWSPLSQRFAHITASSDLKLSHDNVWALYQDDNDILWVGTDNGLNRLDLSGETNIAYATNANLKLVSGQQIIRNIFEYPGDSNRLWIVSGSGLRIFDKTTAKLTVPFYTSDAKQLIEGEFSSGYFVLDNQQIVFFTPKGHYLYNSISGEIKGLPELDEVTSPQLSWTFSGTLPAKKNTVVLSASGHLYSYDLSNKTTTTLYKTKNYQPQRYDTVDNWLIDKNNVLWLAMTGEGLVGLDYETLQEKYRYDTSNKLSTNNIYSLQLDDYNNLWFSSQAGLFRLDSATHHIETFEVDDGLVANEFNGSSYVTLKDRRLVFGSTRGITIISPGEFINKTDTSLKYRVALTGLSLMSDNKRVFSGLSALDSVPLAHDDYGLRLQFSTLQFSKQAKTQYNIELTGPEMLHYKNFSDNELLLPKLSPGDYQLNIVAIDPVTGNRSAPLILGINSLYAPWSSPLARLIFAVLLLAGCGLYISVRNKQQRVLLRAHNKSKASKKQMQLALKGSNSGIWDYHINDDLLYENRLVTELGYDELEQPVSIEQHQRLIHPDDYTALKKTWLDFVKGKTDSLDFSYQMLSNSGEWHWYRDVGRVINRDEQGLPVRVSGTYTNITTTKANEMRAILFGEAFSQISDWVLILDANREPVTANSAFLKTFSVDKRRNIPRFKDFLTALGDQKFQEFQEIIDNIEPGKSWNGEEVITSAEKEQHPVLVSINAIANQSETITHYVIVISDITNQKKAEDKLRHLAHYDFLTNLPNRKLILEKIEHTIDAYQFNSQRFALFFIDLDKFKQVNDSLGHSAGDELLRYVGDTLVSNIKARDLVARQSGDEFMILIDSFDTIDDLSHLAQRLNICLAKSISLKGTLVNITSSIGIAIYPDDAVNSADLIRKADLAMIHAKEAGRSQFQFFTQDMNEKAQQRLILEGDLQQAYIDNDLINFYQPIVHCGQKKVIGFELLLRWPHADGMIPPAIFIPIAEEMGLISKLTEIAVDQALKDYPSLNRQHPDIYISVNLSPIHILQEGLCQTLTNLLDIHQLQPEVLRLEITEGILFTDQKKALSRLRELRSHGFKLLLDDFGTGYSSFTYLSQFPIDVLKIDQSFVRNFDSNPMNQPIIKSMVSLADNLGLSCVAEGVETREQLDYIRSLGCENIQGYFYSKPMAVSDITSFEFKNGIERQFS